MLPGKTAKHLFSVLVGAFFSWFVVGNTFVHVPLSALLVYILVQFAPRRYAPTIVFVTTLGWLSALHIYRLYVDYMGWSLDATSQSQKYTRNVGPCCGGFITTPLGQRCVVCPHMICSIRSLSLFPPLLSFLCRFLVVQCC